MRVFAIAVAATLSGCVIAHDWIARGASGTVVDAASGKPLSGVSVLRTLGDKTTLIATTDSAGQFRVPALDQWYVTVPMGDAVGISELAFRLPGYTQATVDTSTGIPVPRTAPLESVVVKLHRKA
jgi:hypothetical protein